jgi:hypothetical protein
MTLNAVGALRDMGDGNRNQLFGFARQRAILEDGLLKARNAASTSDAISQRLSARTLLGFG